MEKNSGFEIVVGPSSSRGSINNRHDPGNLKEKYFLFKRTRISILVYIIYTLLYRDLNCHLLQIFIICLIQTPSPMESSSVFNLLSMQTSSYLPSGFCRWFLIKTWTEGFCWNERQNCQITVFIVLPRLSKKENNRSLHWC